MAWSTPRSKRLSARFHVQCIAGIDLSNGIKIRTVANAHACASQRAGPKCRNTLMTLIERRRMMQALSIGVGLLSAGVR